MGREGVALRAIEDGTHALQFLGREMVALDEGEQQRSGIAVAKFFGGVTQPASDEFRPRNGRAIDVGD